MTGCILYTDPVNVKPALVISGPDVVHRNAIWTFTATATDDDDEPLEVTWGKVAGACPGEPAILALPAQGEGPTIALQPASELGAFCVWARAVDGRGARAVATKAARAENVGPTVMLKVEGTMAAAVPPEVPLYSTVKLGASATDPDGQGKPTITWTVARGTEKVETRACPEEPGQTAAANQVCFAAESPGQHTVTAVALDADGGMATATTTVTVAEDGPPCIARTMPPANLIRRSAAITERVDFQVLSVEDDGDPQPPRAGQTSQAQFVWRWRRSDGEFARFGISSPTFTLEPNLYRPGDMVEVRVEVLDRKLVRDDVARACQPTAPTCAVRPECPQWITWTVDYRL